MSAGFNKSVTNLEIRVILEGWGQIPTERRKIFLSSVSKGMYWIPLLTKTIVNLPILMACGRGLFLNFVDFETAEMFAAWQLLESSKTPLWWELFYDFVCSGPMLLY